MSFNQFTALLEHLNILSPAHGLKDNVDNKYDHFLPCALRHAENIPDLSQNTSITLGPLLVSFASGFVPSGVFGGLLGYFSKVGWIICKDKKQQPLLYWNHATFFLEQEKSTVTLKKKPEYLEFSIHQTGSASADHNACFNIRNVIDEGIKDTCDKLGYSSSFKNISYGFNCTLCKAQDKHFASYNRETRHLKCPKSYVSDKLEDEDKRTWWFDSIKLLSNGCVYTVKNSYEQRVDWQEKGIMTITVPAGAVAPGNSCDITVAPVSPTKNCIFLDGSVLVSEIFEVTTSCDIIKPITIKLQHCVQVTGKSQIASLAFAKAERNHPNDKSSPLIFEKLEGGCFDVGSKYAGSIKCERFSYFSIIWDKKRRVPCPLRCSVLMYYSESDSSAHTVHIVVTKNLGNNIEPADYFLSGSQFLNDVPLVMTGNKITFKSKVESDDGNWSIKPAEDSCEIERDDIEAYNAGTQNLPKVQYYLTPKRVSSVQFIHTFGLKGTQETKKLNFRGPSKAPNKGSTSHDYDIVGRYVAIKDYEAEEYLSLRKGDMIEVLQEYWTGTNKKTNQCGLVPSTYLRGPLEQISKGNHTFVAIEDFSTKLKGHISFKEDDHIVIDIFHGQYNEKKGKIAADCIKPLELKGKLKQLVKEYPDAQGIAVVLAADTDPDCGTIVDYASVGSVFKNQLNFAVFQLFNPFPVEVEEIVQTLYSNTNLPWLPDKYKFIVFYFSGHGGMSKNDGTIQILPCKQIGKTLQIFPTIIDPLHYLPHTKLFFFDCCLLEIHKHLQKQDDLVQSDERCLTRGEKVIAFATSKGLGTVATQKEGGIWTKTLVELLPEKKSLQEILGDTAGKLKKLETSMKPHWTSEGENIYLNGRGNEN